MKLKYFVIIIPPLLNFHFFTFHFNPFEGDAALAEDSDEGYGRYGPQELQPKGGDDDERDSCAANRDEGNEHERKLRRAPNWHEGDAR